VGGADLLSGLWEFGLPPEGDAGFALVYFAMHFEDWSKLKASAKVLAQKNPDSFDSRRGNSTRMA